MRALAASVVLLVLRAAAAANVAIARLYGAQPGSVVSGHVIFEQAENAPLGDVTVRLVGVAGLRPGVHGFHVHQ